MNKVSLLAASVALALTGCGGSDSDTHNGSAPAPGGVIITGFDGYFNQAVIFDDKNNNSELDGSDTILGLTDSKGQLSLSEQEFSSATRLSLQTLTPGGTKQAELIARDPNLFAGKYTIDMDHPTQAMEHEVVFRTLKGESIISPLTDLVVIEAGTNPTNDDIEQAKIDVNEALGLPEDSDAAFTDVIADNDSELHKTAQILTESKAAAEEKDASYDPVAVAKEATVVVDSLTPEQVSDDNYKPVVDGNTTTDPVINNKLVVNASVKEHMLVTLEPLESHEGINLILPLVYNDENLFADEDQNNDEIAITATIATTTQEVITGVTLTAINGDLTIKGTPNLIRDTYIISLTANDIDNAQGAAGSTTTTFELEVNIENKAPVADSEVKAELKTWFGELNLNQGMKVNATHQIDNLFTDPESDTLTYKAYSSVAGLELELVKDNSTGITELKISGSPAHTYTAGETISISAQDSVSTVTEIFLLAEIQGQSISIKTEQINLTQQYITTTLGELKVGESITDNSFSIVDIFDTTNVDGTVGYYAGLALELDNHEYQTSVPGVTVSVDNNGILSISGSPTKATNDAYFLVAAGVNPDAEDGIVSEMVRLALPNVQTKDNSQSISIKTEQINLIQQYITTTLGELKVGESITDNSFSIVDMFDTTNVSGTVGYYAGLALELDNHEYQTSVPGITVNVDNNGILSISGIPTEATNDAYFLVAAGVNPDAEDGIVSEMVRLALPNVQPKDGTTTPPIGLHPLENKNWYILERGSSDGDNDDSNDYSRVWCDTYRFENGVVLNNTRTLANKQTCSETGLVQEESGSYTVDGNNIIATFIFEEKNDNGILEEITETITVSIKDDTNAPTDMISEGAKSITFTVESHDEVGQFEHESRTFFADRLDAEKRINVLSSDNAESRDAPLYWPGEQDNEYILRSTSLQMAEADVNNSYDYIKIWINGVSCDGLLSQAESGDPAIFEKFIVSSDSISAGGQHLIYANENSCFTAMEDNTPNAVISFPFDMNNNYSLNMNESYSIMGKISDNWSQFITDINFNMTWDGSTNNE